MKKLIICLLLVTGTLSLQAQSTTELNDQKKAVIASVDKHASELTAMSDEIWAHAETALREYMSSKVLSDYAALKGFEVEIGIAGMPTAFIASYGSGRPIIGILGEFDALPGISQKATAHKEALNEGAAARWAASSTR